MNLLAKSALAAAFILLIAGGMVTSTGSGLAVPDWPLSFGRFYPPMEGGVFFEHGHRMIAGMVMLLTFILTAVARRHESRYWVKAAAYAACAAIMLQALLGGLTVLLRLPPLVSVSHACLAQAVFCLILTVAQATSPWYTQTAHPSLAGGSWKLGIISLSALYLQLIWGAVVRHTGQAVGLHILWAAVAAAAALYPALKSLNNFPNEGALSRPAMLVAVLIPAQLALGALAYAIRFMPDFPLGFAPGAVLTTAHLGVGALLLGTSLVWTLRAYKLR